MENERRSSGRSVGSRGGFGGHGGGGFSSGPREMSKVICADCGVECEVPFKPGKDAEGNLRPVYCRDCYQKHKKF